MLCRCLVVYIKFGDRLFVNIAEILAGGVGAKGLINI